MYSLHIPSLFLYSHLESVFVILVLVVGVDARGEGLVVIVDDLRLVPAAGVLWMWERLG